MKRERYTEEEIQTIRSAVRYAKAPTPGLPYFADQLEKDIDALVFFYVCEGYSADEVLKMCGGQSFICELNFGNGVTYGPQTR